MSRPATAVTRLFTAPVARWLATAFPVPTRVQVEGWPVIARGDHTLLLAPTGSGKTLAAFLWAIDRCTLLDPAEGAGVRVLYVSPLKALAHDIERNLVLPIEGIVRAAGGRAGLPWCPRVGLRTGDTPAAERRAFRRDPPEILVTTPESLFLLLTSGAREMLRRVEWVIVDEIHALAASRRGAHLALSLERLAALTPRDPQRIGLSATARPASTVADFLGGSRPVRIVDVTAPPRLAVRVEAPWADGAGEASVRVEAAEVDAPRSSIASSKHLDRSARAGAVESTVPATAESAADPRRRWIEREAHLAAGGDGLRPGVWPAIETSLACGILDARSTIVFVNSRGACERLARRLDELTRGWQAQAEGVAPDDGPPLVLAHHGSIARERRREIEEMLATGALRAVVATSSLELGIDMAAVDHVVLAGSPGSVATALQRVGRAGHTPGEISRGTLLARHPAELLEAAVVVEGMERGAVEALCPIMNPLDVLAQQIVAMVALEDWSLERLEALVRRAAPWRDLSRAALLSVCDLLSGRWPSTDFADLRPRLDFDRVAGRLHARPGAARIAIANAGTIPDRGLWPVHLGLGGPRVGELDEEMVYETRPGQVVMLGASAWRVLDIGRDRVVVEAAPGEAGRLPFWRGEGTGRPVELGGAIGARLRELDGLDASARRERAVGLAGLDANAAAALADLLTEQRAATGALPSDVTVVVERFRDELGDWRVALLSPWGSRVHAPWALAVEGVLASRAGLDVQAVWNDDGILLRLGDSGVPPTLDFLVPRASEIEELLVGRLGTTALFAGLFREGAARALLLPRRMPGRRTPLWVQRHKARHLLAAARRYPSFPIVLETYRTCLQDVFDLAALRTLLAGIEAGSVRVVEVETRGPSPLARSLVRGLEASRMYSGDEPAAETRARALALDRGLLRELLGATDLRSLLDEAAIAEVAGELQHLSPERRARSPEALHDLLRALGALTVAEMDERCEGEASTWLETLAMHGRALSLEIAGRIRWIAAEEAGLWRDAVAARGPGLADGRLPTEFLDPVDDAVAQVLRRWTRQRGPFTSSEVTRDLGLSAAAVTRLLASLEDEGLLERGGFLPLAAGAPGGGPADEWVERDVLRRIRGRTLARVRAEIAPVDAATFARFTLAWHGAIFAQDRPPALDVAVESLDRPQHATSRAAMAPPALDVALESLDRPQHATSRAAMAPPALDAALESLEGLPLSFREFEEVLLPLRTAEHGPADLDRRIASGEWLWFGRGRLSRDDGRIVVCRRAQAALLCARPDESSVDGASVAGVVLGVLRARGACFFHDLALELDGVAVRALRDALWALVWAGLVTNDGFEPLRRRGRERAGKSGRVGRGGGAGGAVSGRWSRTAPLFVREVDPTRTAHAQAQALLERHGIVARATLAPEPTAGGFARIYPVLRVMEEQGRVRRGHFVAGLEGAQFALPAAVERLRAARSASSAAAAVVLAACDPAQPFGGALPWPALVAESHQESLRRIVGARVVLLDGEPLLYATPAGRMLFTFPAMRDGTRALAAARALATAAGGRTRRAWCSTTIDGRPAAVHPLARVLVAAGFAADHRGFRLW